jgi:hypothetical protein
MGVRGRSAPTGQPNEIAGQESAQKWLGHISTSGDE